MTAKVTRRNFIKALPMLGILLAGRASVVALLPTIATISVKRPCKVILRGVQCKFWAVKGYDVCRVHGAGMSHEGRLVAGRYTFRGKRYFQLGPYEEVI